MVVRTTIALDGSHRDRLLELKKKWGLSSLEQVIARLLEGRPETAAALYRRNRKAVDAVIRKRGLRHVVAFGSRARGDARADSDLDIALDLPKEADLFDLIDVKDELTAAFGLPVDVVELGGLNPRVRRNLERDGVLLHA